MGGVQCTLHGLLSVSRTIVTKRWVLLVALKRLRTIYVVRVAQGQPFLLIMPSRTCERRLYCVELDDLRGAGEWSLCLKCVDVVFVRRGRSFISLSVLISILIRQFVF